MALSPRLLRPRASGSGLHPEAFDWVSRVTANGGTASTNTLAAVSKFCADIDAAGIRNKFYRLNLFCGQQLAAALVPLYSAESMLDSVRGNATDTNVNFVSGDYQETGSGGGLKGDGNVKNLQTGVASDSISPSSNHLAVYGSGLNTPTVTWTLLIGARTPATLSSIYCLQTRASNADINRFLNGSSSGATASAAITQGMILGSAVSSTDSRVYTNGLQSGSTITLGGGPFGSNSIWVFSSSGLTAVEATSARLCMYSIGLGLTPTQSLAYYNAAQAFQSTLGRQT